MEGMRSLEKNGSRNFRGLAILTKKMDPTVVIFLFVSQAPLHKKRSFQLGISAVNVTKSTDTVDLVTFTEESLMKHVIFFTLLF